MKKITLDPTDLHMRIALVIFVVYTITPIVVVVVNILFQIKRNASMIGHCTALAVIATKALAGKTLNQNKTEMKILLHLMCWCDNQRGVSAPGFITD